jgi:arylsulfatase A
MGQYEGSSRRDFIKYFLGAGTVTLLASYGTPARGLERLSFGIPTSLAVGGKLPNIVIINADDLGYGDLSCYGSESVNTPNIDRLAAQGTRFTDFYSCNAICTPSRFGLLTGRYPQRVGLYWALWMEDLPFFQSLLRRHFGRFLNKIGSTDIGAGCAVGGIPEDEITIAEGLKKVGYTTGIVGKWHLGDFRVKKEYNPRNHGFDSFYGLPWDHEEVPCPLYRDYECIMPEVGVDYTKLHTILANGAVEFIEKNKANPGPFFLYYAPPDPHVPLHPSEKYQGKSEGGIYGDVVEELDANVGTLLDCLKKNGLEENTLVFFTSDNGPWYHGSTHGLRGRKGQSYEGGFRVPMIARWPDHIKAGSVCSEPAMNIDFLPTCFSITGATLPKDRIIDGKDISGLLIGTEAKTPHEYLYYYHHAQLEAVRTGDWKFIRSISTYVYPIPVDHWRFDAPKGQKGVWEGPWLYNIRKDPDECYPLTDDYPKFVKAITRNLEDWEKGMKDNPKGWLK